MDQSTTGQSYCGIRNTVGYGARSVLMPRSGWGNDVSLGLEWFDPSQTLIPATSTDDCHSQPSGNMFNHNDLTSYTYPYWVSDYTYGLLAEQIALVDSWEAGSESNTCRTKDRTVQWRRFEDGKIKQGRGFKSTELTDAPLRCVSQAGVGWFPASRRSVSLDVRTARGIGQEVMELIEFAPPDGFVGQCDVWGIQRPAQYRD